MIGIDIDTQANSVVMRSPTPIKYTSSKKIVKKIRKIRKKPGRKPIDKEAKYHKDILSNLDDIINKLEFICQDIRRQRG